MDLVPLAGLVQLAARPHPRVHLPQLRLLPAQTRADLALAPAPELGRVVLRLARPIARQVVPLPLPPQALQRNRSRIRRLQHRPRLRRLLCMLLVPKSLLPWRLALRVLLRLRPPQRLRRCLLRR